MPIVPLPVSPTLPVSDHCDGRRFFNPAAIIPPPTGPHAPRALSILRWQWGRRRRIARWPARLDNPAPAGDPHAHPAPGHAQITFIGHSTFLLRLPCNDGSTLTVLTDPVFSDRCSPVRWAGPRRVRPPGRAIADLPRIDVVLVSHCHYDHLDLPSLARIGRRDAPVVLTPPGNARHLRKAGLGRAGLGEIVELDWWEEMGVGQARFTCTPARHGSARTPFDRNRALWGGFTIHADTRTRGDTPSVFFAGDSGHGRHWRLIRDRLGAPDIALLPVGAYDPRVLMEAVHTTPEESVQAMLDLDAARAVGMHFGTFRLTDEPIDEPLRRLAVACAAAGLEPERFTSLNHGECRDFAPLPPVVRP
ncbi:MBL fold metallo-hydrolase [Gluconacetobacter azotocaptans]|uniref:MBL fold metallo-hydrolase n=1 Tax=Gluconacetobacter azotocaptans TaxID=142834 RepID=UPI001959D505|nr:MBL fold metallo-hydrolase [Gluconacetobacter azotocaptans]MBM9403316.1 MBL fold metallo-hydrolase [Gluconacetobacter azotocaptans]